jgi:microsomal dipeptidase-like Zn-dependent dipeptidase
VAIGSEYEENDETGPDEEEKEEVIANLFREIEENGEHNAVAEAVRVGNRVDLWVEQI